MDQRLSLITLGVDDLGRARRFYEALGWRGHEVEETVFFQGGGIVLSLWSREKLAADSGAPLPSAGGAERGFDGVVLAHNVRSEAEVEEILAVAAQAGGAITREAGPTFYDGYAGCFADPDGHIWEVAHNPGFPLAEDGSIRLPF